MKKEIGLLLAAAVCLIYAAGLVLSPFPEQTPDMLLNTRNDYAAERLSVGFQKPESARKVADRPNNIPIRKAAANQDTDSFVIALEDGAGSFNAEFLRLSADSVTPKEWDVSRFLFLSAGGVYLACTDLGIWRIDPESQTAVRLSADAFQGRTRAEILSELQEGGGLFRTGNPVLSPNGRYLAYCSDHTDEQSGGDAVWALDTATGEEHLLMPAKNTRKLLHGFISDKNIFVEITDSRDDTRKFALADATTGNVAALDFNAADDYLTVHGVSANGNAAMIRENNNNNADETLFLLRIGADGMILNQTEFPGHYPDGAKFSPSGGRLAAPVSDESETAADEILLIDIRTGEGQRLDAGNAGGQIRDYAWANESSLLIDCGGNSGVTWLYHCD